MTRLQHDEALPSDIPTQAPSRLSIPEVIGNAGGEVICRLVGDTNSELGHEVEIAVEPIFDAGDDVDGHEIVVKHVVQVIIQIIQVVVEVGVDVLEGEVERTVEIESVAGAPAE